MHDERDSRPRKFLADGGLETLGFPIVEKTPMKTVAGSAKPCPECAAGRLEVVFKAEVFDFDYGSETVRVEARDVPVETCDQCGESFSGPAAAMARHNAICRAYGLMTPSEIKELRERFGWSQQRLAELTDFGIATLSRWERGRLLQNRSANKVLLALRDCPEFRAYLERQSRDLPDASEAQSETPVRAFRPRYGAAASPQLADVAISRATQSEPIIN